MWCSKLPSISFIEFTQSNCHLIQYLWIEFEKSVRIVQLELSQFKRFFYFLRWTTQNFLIPRNLMWKCDAFSFDEVHVGWISLDIIKKYLCPWCFFFLQIVALFCLTKNIQLSSGKIRFVIFFESNEFNVMSYLLMFCYSMMIMFFFVLFSLIDLNAKWVEMKSNLILES